MAVRDDANMAVDWTVRWHKPESLLYYFNPKGERKHKIKFSDAMRASFQWRVFTDPPEAKEPPTETKPN